MTYGKKFENLKKLSYEKLNIPSLYPIKEIKRILSTLNLSEKRISEIYSSKDALKKLSEIRNKIDKLDIKLENRLNTKDFIVRSSSNVEDSKKSSFAGIFDSIRTKDIEKGVKKVLKSFFSERLYHYIKNQKEKIPKVGIFIQEFIEGDISGVLFTEFHKNGKKGYLLNIKRGTAENVVSGADVKSYFIENENYSVSFLNQSQLLNLIDTGKKIEEIMKSPQDIEFTIKDSKLYILQSRPITKNFSENFRVWDNSNIVESYSGIVLPLTISFARRAYKVAYINLLKTVGMSERTMKENEEVFDNLLGFFYGRFYYNMLNWYRMASLFPGYEKNKENLNNMLSAKTQADLDKKNKKNVNLPFKIKYYTRIAFLYPVFDYRMQKFQSLVYKTFSEFDKVNLKKLDLDSLTKLYLSFENELLSQWSMTLENDFMLMTFFGKIKDYGIKKKIPENEIIETISNLQNVASANQVKFLRKLASDFKNHKELVKLSRNYKKCFEEIYKNPNYSKLKQKINNYLKLYGNRFASDLKLESISIKEKPESIIELLNQYPIGKEDKLIAKKKRIKSAYLSFLTKKIKEYIRYREENRLLRSRAFGIVREIFNEIGRRLALEGSIQNERDIFYLELDEIIRYIKGSSSMHNLKDLIKMRKNQYTEYENSDIDGLFSTKGSPYLSIPKKIDKQSQNIFGKACSPGIVKGKVTILKEFKLPKKEEYEIVVAKNTDPGWTPLFGLCKGLIIEQGGILSHAAIVSRELNLPCVISATNALSKLKNGQVVTINGSDGSIKIDG